jgi:hypothetical protein
MIARMPRSCLKKHGGYHLRQSPDNTPAGLERVRLAILKLAGGNLDELRKQVDAAKRDWRDVINPAEYPEASGLGFIKYKELDQQTKEEIKRRDREQYETWLREGFPDNPIARLWQKIIG